MPALPMGKNAALTNMAQDYLCGTLWHFSNYWHIPLRKPDSQELNNIFNNYRPDFGCHGWHFDLGWPFVYSNGSKLNVVNTSAPHCLWGKWRNPEGWSGQEKSDNRPLIFVRASLGVYLILSWSPEVYQILSREIYWYWCRFPRVWTKR